MENTTGTPTLEECFALYKQKDTLNAEISELELECVGLRASVAYLKETQHKLRISTAQLCYDLSNLFNLMGTLADTEQEHLWTRFQENMITDKQDTFNF